MPWVHLDDQFPDHPKVVSAGGDAAWLFVCGLAYCKRFNTGGAIPRGQVGKLTDRRSPLKLADTLVRVLLWEPAENGFQVHDYSEWNRSSESRSEAGRKGAHARWHDKGNAFANANGNAIASVSHIAQDAHIPIPIPKAAAASKLLTHDVPVTGGAAALSEAALGLIADRRVAANKQVSNPGAYRKAVLEGLRTDYAERLADVDLVRDWTPETLANWLEPAPVVVPSNFAPGSGRLPNWSLGES